MRQRCARLLCALLLVTIAGLTARPGEARVWLAEAYPDRDLAGAAAAKGAVIWSHGRSYDKNDAEVAPPPYLSVLRDAGWDVFRFNRNFEDDGLAKSGRRLAGIAAEMKSQGYDRVVLSGQSFGAFVSLIAAGESDAVDAVVATAPAAYGSFFDSYDTWQKNSSRLYPLLESVGNARVMLFFFHGDEYDPGGRGETARAILAASRTHHVVIDQPSDLAGHGAAATGLFARRFGGCIREFAEGNGALDPASCEAPWGRRPSPSLATPDLLHPASFGTGTSTDKVTPFAGRWYGFYVNGREVLLQIERIEDGEVVATYGLGPGLDPRQTAERTQLKGKVVGDELVFEEPGKNGLRFRQQPNGSLAATWRAADGSGSLEATLRRLD